MKILAALLLGSTVLSAADATPWENLTSAQGDITVTLKNGKTVKRTDTVAFQSTELRFSSN